MSMGRVGDDGNLRCFYHGWAFGKDGFVLMSTSSSLMGRSRRTLVLKQFAAEEVDGIVYVWRGPLLEADASKLPQKVPDATPTYPRRHRFRLQGRIRVHRREQPRLRPPLPPARRVDPAHRGARDEAVEHGQLADEGHAGRFRDLLHVGKLRGALKPNKLVSFDAPNIVRHGGVSGFHEEFHIVPIAPNELGCS